MGAEQAGAEVAGGHVSPGSAQERRLPAELSPLEEWGFGEIAIRPAEYQVFVEGRRVPLTRREFQVFHCLARRADRVVTRQQIHDEVWGGTMAHRDRSVDVFVRKVRQKLASVAPETRFIHTHFGVGYRLAAERPAPRSSPSESPAGAAPPTGAA